ncbi:DUF1294 domain-containing protein [Bacillus songklensis]|uniref:DUF1294 domain-containing protein n=1 Tax=Bacillus songklensis TaxID=1069116 RepID=A0ABV8B1W8_9BACI
MGDFIFVYYVLINTVGLLIMAVDKSRAKHHGWRIRERTIWICSLFGGAIGSTVGMSTFRHKTKHPQFKVGLPLLAIGHLFILFQFM